MGSADDRFFKLATIYITAVSLLYYALTEGLQCNLKTADKRRTCRMVSGIIVPIGAYFALKYVGPKLM